MADTEPQAIAYDVEGVARRVFTDGAELAEPRRPAELEAAEPTKAGKTSARAAVSMRISGAGYDDIARVLDYRSAAVARQVVEETLANAFPDESREALRRLTGARLEGLMKKIAPKTEALVAAIDEEGRVVRTREGDVVREQNPEQLAHVKAMADLISRHARIMGVEQLDISITPTNEQYSATMRALLAQRAGGAKEASPFDDSEDYIDAEVVEIEEGDLDG